MEPARDVLAQFLDDVNDDLADDDVEAAQKRIKSFQDEYDLQIREGGIAIGVHIDIWSYDYKDGLCSFGTRRLISRISHAPAEVVDGGFQQHFAELQPPAPRTHGSAERALDA